MTGEERVELEVLLTEWQSPRGPESLISYSPRMTTLLLKDREERIRFMLSRLGAETKQALIECEIREKVIQNLRKSIWTEAADMANNHVGPLKYLVDSFIDKALGR